MAADPMLFEEADIPRLQAVVRDGARRTAPGAWIYLLVVVMMLVFLTLQKYVSARFSPLWQVPLPYQAAAAILVLLVPGWLALVGRRLPLEQFLRLCGVVHLVAVPVYYLLALPLGMTGSLVVLFDAVGMRLFRKAGRMRTMRPPVFDVQVLSNWRERLQRFVEVGEDAANRAVKACVTQGPFCGLCCCTGRLLQDRLVLFSRELDDLFVVEKQSLRAAMVNRSRTVMVGADGCTLRIDWTAPSVLIVKEWCELSVTPYDIAAAAEAQANEDRPPRPAPTSVLLPLEVVARTAEVAAMARMSVASAKDGVLSYLDDAAPEVAAAALDACLDLEIDGLQHRALPFLQDPAAPLRVAAARYLAAFPCDGALVSVSRAVGGESDPAARSALAKSRFLLRLKA